jgi:hypothetical protein
MKKKKIILFLSARYCPPMPGPLSLLASARNSDLIRPIGSYSGPPPPPGDVGVHALAWSQLNTVKASKAYSRLFKPIKAFLGKKIIFVCLSPMSTSDPFLPACGPGHRSAMSLPVSAPAAGKFVFIRAIRVKTPGGWDSPLAATRHLVF